MTPDPGGALVTWPIWVVSWLWLVHQAVMSIVVVLFPQRGPRGRLDRSLITIITLTTGVSMVAAALRPGLIVTTPDNPDGAPVHALNPLGISRLASLLDSIDSLYLISALIVNLVLLGLVLVRWRRSRGIERRQYRWAFLLAIGNSIVAPLVEVFPAGVGPVFAIATTFAFQMFVVVAILKWVVYEARVVLRRSALAATLLVVAIGMYGGRHRGKGLGVHPQGVDHRSASPRHPHRGRRWRGVRPSDGGPAGATALERSGGRTVLDVDRPGA